MKKQMFALFISCLFGALYLNAQSVDVETAKAVATHFFNSRSIQPSAEMREVPNTSNNGKTYYLFEPTVGNGFVMVSSERSLSPVLAYSFTQKFNLDGAPENLKFWLNNYQQQIQLAAQNRLRPGRELNEKWTNLLTGAGAELRTARKIGPLLTTSWGQSPLYNQLCPKNSRGEQAVTGCVATAMSQIMKYWNYPLVGRGGIASTEDTDASDGIAGVFSANIGGTKYNWNDMPDIINSTQWASIAQLMRDAGISVKMNYGTSESGALSANVPAAMHNYFGYNESEILSHNDFDNDEWEDMMRTSLDRGVPVYYAGRKLDASGKVEGSHAWVCDGYENNHFHMNWGWDGKYGDLWVALDFLKLDPGDRYSYDQRAIFDLTPQDCLPNFFSSGVAIKSVQVAHWIHANSTVAPLPGLNVVFDAHDEVTLLPGFTAPEGSSFTALIEGCGGDNAQGNQEEEMSFPTSSVPERSNTKSAEINSVAKALSVAPNPFSGSTTVTYTLESEQLVAAQLLDMTGRLMASPISQQLQVSGEHRFTLEANNLPAGLYFLVLQTGAKRQTQRIVITK